jgi:hypothetical protein
MASLLSRWHEKRKLHKLEMQIPAQSGHMERAHLRCVFALTVFAVGALVVFHGDVLATLTGPSPGKSSKASGLRSFEILPLETVSETSANASIGDLNGDGHLDIVLAKGRHWAVPSRIFFGDGKGNFTPGPALRSKATKTYSASLADMTKRATWIWF